MPRSATPDKVGPSSEAQTAGQIRAAARPEKPATHAATPSKRALHPVPAREAEHVAKERPPKTANAVQGSGGQTASSPRIHALDELPAEIRRQIPALVIGGASYSSNPSSRMLIVNGQVFHERDRLTPDLQLQQIRLKSAVLDFKGYRYEIKY